MATFTHYRNVEFTGGGSNLELLTIASIKSAIMARLGLTTDAEYTALITEGIRNMDFAIYTSGTRISINNEDYAFGELVADSIYETGDYARIPITSIRLETGTTGKFSFNIL